MSANNRANIATDSQLMVCRTNQDSPACAIAILNHPQGLPGPNNKDMEILLLADSALTQLPSTSSAEYSSSYLQ